MSDIRDPQFLDGFGKIEILGGAVRIELLNLRPSSTGDATTNELAVVGQIIVPLDGFLHALTAQNAFADRLIGLGAIEKSEGGAFAVRRERRPAAE